MLKKFITRKQLNNFINSINTILSFVILILSKLTKFKLYRNLGYNYHLPDKGMGSFIPYLNLVIKNIEISKDLIEVGIGNNSTPIFVDYVNKVNENNFKMKIKKFLLRTKSSSFIDVEKVKVQTLDSLFINEERSIDLLKIDTEGFEHEVLLGAKNLLKNKKVKHIIIEFQNDDTYMNYSPSEIHEFITANNFKLKKIFKFRFIGIEDRIYSIS